MSEERTRHHSEEPAEGTDEAVEEPGAQRAGETDEAAEGTAPPSQHPEEPAEGSEEDEQAPGANKAR